MWIDIARAIAMLCVIIGHSLYQYTDSTFGHLIYNFHMPLFFIFSGYLYHATFTTNDYLKITLVVLYRMIIPLTAAMLIPHIPGLRSLFLNRSYPFKKRSVKNHAKA
ncbi:hypothetical protein FC99_GL001832 [Levilactobacillus koreensis JCM 16448]|nr:hypothetical protein FC99_GL001832 [Levilactobacillus koreensis JCM 16448]